MKFLSNRMKRAQTKLLNKKYRALKIVIHKLKNKNQIKKILNLKMI